MSPAPGDCWYFRVSNLDMHVMTCHSIVFLECHGTSGWLALRIFETGRVQIIQYPKEWVNDLYTTAKKPVYISRIA